MTKDLEMLKDALQRDPSPPNRKVKRTALTVAMARFEEKHAGRLQGNTAPMRPSSNGGTGPSAIWRKLMDALKPSRSGWTPVLAGGASLAVLMIAVVSTGVINPAPVRRRRTVAEAVGRCRGRRRCGDNEAEPSCGWRGKDRRATIRAAIAGTDGARGEEDLGPVRPSADCRNGARRPE